MGDKAWLVRAVLDAVCPPLCAVCSAPAWEGEGLCGRCAARLPGRGPACPTCGRRAGAPQAVGPCPACADEDLGLDGAVAAWPYAGAARDLVLALKFRGRLGALRPLATGLADALRARSLPGDVLVPLPLAASRRRSRGFDQAALLAAEVAGLVEAAYDPRALVRVRADPPQVGRARRQRLRAPRGAFRARRHRVAGRCVLLVDDVLTTGGTARAAALALRRAGASSVVAAVACRAEARAPPPAG